MKYKWLFFGLSLAVLLPGVVTLAIFGLKPSIDFSGGSILELRLPDATTAPTVQEVQSLASDQDLANSAVSMPDGKTYIFKSKPITASVAGEFKQALGDKYGRVSEIRFETVGPVIGRELTQRAVLALVVATSLVVGYIAWSFRSVPKPYSAWKFGVSAVLALLHDTVVVLGLFAIFGKIWGVEVDALFVTAMLTVMGFSVHDTIVVFDRVRENLPKMAGKTFEEVMDFSIGETLVRSLNTSFTVILTLTALVLFGGENIRWFVTALLIGMVSGTYSSLCTASPILVLWESKARKSLQ